ncbi:hypothetical protein EJ08DRAFT_94873 [Tothia fuscella]|uniref:Uncharacterized protein n=1 Tax=Tothia fuscella TaxID=1048955 RepID=A0A9P4NXQ5_9PEZI|nr:hypothetical protein EJ08DRAFT_94873 [Tothia fuscella]
MRPTLLLAQQQVLQLSGPVLPIALLVTSTLSSSTTPYRHSLFANAIAWLVICVGFGVKLGVKIGAGSARKRRLSWLAGLLYALALVCDRAAADQEGVWWSKALLPLAVYVVFRCAFERDGTAQSSEKNNTTTLDRINSAGIWKLLLVATGTSIISLGGFAFTRFPVSILGLCSVLLMASAFLILEYNLGVHQEERVHSPMSRRGPHIGTWQQWSQLSALSPPSLLRVSIPQNGCFDFRRVLRRTQDRLEFWFMNGMPATIFLEFLLNVPKLHLYY